MVLLPAYYVGTRMHERKIGCPFQRLALREGFAGASRRISNWPSPTGSRRMSPLSFYGTLVRVDRGARNKRRTPACMWIIYVEYVVA